MKKIKHYALGLLGAALVTAGIIACSSEEANSTQQETAATAWNKSGSTFTGGPVATITNGVAALIHSEADIKASLIAKGIFTDVESVEVAYGLNPDTKLQEAFVTVIGKETASAAPLAIVADLTINGNQLIINNPSDNQQAFSTHTCIGTNCGWCQFDRTWFLGRIKGCKPCSRVIDKDSSSACNHSTSTGSAGTIILETSKTLISPFK